jgi:hypothetical protein
MRPRSVILLLLSLCFASFVLYSLMRLEPLEVSGGRLQRMGDSVVVTGSVINTGSRMQTAGLKVQLYDQAGHKLAAQDVALGKLAPGQSVAFTSRPIRNAQAAKFTIQVDRGANMYGN